MSKTIDRLVKIIKSKKGQNINTSYTALLLSKGTAYCQGKLKEEVEELHEAIKNKKNIVHESADVIYHLLVALESSGVNFNEVIKELERREGTSGLEEKRNR
jgi:phosphoribosyl-ATP pyrophosphohydrolase